MSNKKILANKMQAKINKTKNRILWTSNAPWAPTGYGQQTAQVTPRLLKDDYAVAIAANYGLEASNTIWNCDAGSIPVYARGHDMYSNDIIPAHMHDWSLKEKNAKSLLITLFDVWVFKGDKWADWNVASWVPVDHLPAPPDVSAWCRQKFVTPIAMSKFGQNMLQNVGIESEYVPHGIEPIFKPTNEIIIKDEKISPRSLMGIPEDAFVVGMNAANKGVYPNRKAFGENLLAFSFFAKKYSDAVLYLHTEPTGSLGGIRLMDLIISCGIDPKRVIFPDPYALRNGINQEILASYYTSMDVLLATSYGEGFGIPTIEAQACGTRVIASDFAASAELVGDGWKIGGQPLWDAPQKSFFHIPNIDEIMQALVESYNIGHGRSDKAIEFAKNYNADFVYDTHWKPTLKRIFDKIEIK